MALRRSSGVEHTLRQTAEALGNLGVVDSSILVVGHVYGVFEAVSALLVLTNQAEIGVVQDDHDDRLAIHGGNGDFLAKEGEAEVADDGDAGALRMRDLRAERGGNLVAECARSAGGQIAHGLVDLLQLTAPDLGDAAARGEHGVAVEASIDLVEDAMRHDGAVVVVGLALHGGAHGVHGFDAGRPGRA